MKQEKGNRESINAISINADILINIVMGGSK